MTTHSHSWRQVSADDYAEPLAGMIRRGEIEPPDELVIDDPPYIDPDVPLGTCVIHGDYWTENCLRCGW